MYNICYLSKSRFALNTMHIVDIIILVGYIYDLPNVIN